MTDRLLVDVRRFAIPPGRPIGGEPFDRRPRRVVVTPLVRRWLRWWRGGTGGGELEAEPAYISDWERPRR